MGLIEHIKRGGRVRFADTGTPVDVKEVTDNKIVVYPMLDRSGSITFNTDGVFRSGDVYLHLKAC